MLGVTSDPGVLLEVDREDYLVRVRDLRDGVEGPAIRVAMGSPAHPTPSGEYPLYHVVRNPGWSPGPIARRLGADSEPPSAAGPLGAAKIPFHGPYALHGGSERILLGKPVTLGCLRGTNPAVLRLVDWLGERGVLGRELARGNGESLQRFRRPGRIVIR